MILEPDVLVIGGGMAGLTAGTVAVKAGLDTVIIRAGQGATALSSGAIDVAGYLRGGTVPIASPLEGVVAMTNVHTLHPYSIIAYDDDEGIVPERAVRRVENAVMWLHELLKDSPASSIGDLRTNRMQLTQLGTVKPTCLVQESMDHKGLFDDGSKVLFMGVRGLPDFHASIAAKTFLQYQILQEGESRVVLNETVDISPHGRPYNITQIELARYLDTADGRDQLLYLLEREVHKTGATHVALPAVLGLTNAQENVKRYCKEVGAIVFETLALPPSVPGVRLQTALDTRFQECGGTLLPGYRAVSGHFETNRLTEVVAKGPRREITIRPKAVILATGKFIGEGLSGTEHGVRENLFGLVTVTDEYYDASEILPKRYTEITPLATSGHKIFQFGVAVDNDLRPVDVEGEPQAENLFAAGSILAGYNYSAEKSGLGVALVTGHVAGENAIRHVRRDA